MVDRREYFELDMTILMKLREGNKTYSYLERSVNTNFDTIKDHCRVLEKYGMIEINKKEKHPENGRIFYDISLTDHGHRMLNKELEEKED